MRILFLLYGDPAAEAAMTAEERRAIVGEHIAFHSRLTDEGRLVAGEALTGSALTVRPDQELVTDGPYAETKEQLGAVYIVDCADLDAATQLANDVPRSPGLVVEIRPVA